MKLNHRKAIVFFFLIPLLVYLWPVQLYGNTNYIMLVGESMTPTIDSGTLIVTQPEEKYFLGDIIAFVNEDGLNVVHRIVEKTEQGFVTKGDNNPRNDPDYITNENVLGRAIFVLPYLGFTSMFLKTSLGMAIFGIFAVAMLVPRKSSKTKTRGQQSFVVYNVVLGVNMVNYVMTQITLGDDINFSKTMSIPFANFFEPFLASTISFAMLSMVIIILQFVARNIDGNPNENNLMKLILIMGAIMILIPQLMNIFNLLPFFTRVAEEQWVPYLMNLFL
ncbi:MAG: signal peptidase I [Thaumarchaeota archaeon]|nr:MAG: signal peptidase I [Nitrososphaerota archaeon]